MIVVLQGATTVDEVEARMRWETANADGKNAAFDPAVPGPKFRAPDRTAAVARASPLVAAAYRSDRLLSSPVISCSVVIHSALLSFSVWFVLFWSVLFCPVLFCPVLFSSLLLFVLLCHILLRVPVRCSCMSNPKVACKQYC